ncbi:uncharacterized protein GGS25DRAFT_487838 [Hypoxylon fragiforme]|uniref:uncharacterized protein n=1 Tax=Hypoxylon fragiforme TaxID=63214 RepID=UPI0020C636AE|nr:uncharacterized protein GGS25DRAFT_487838 [Hypoxylon fragiforme]KAI2610177.1 hypothetical protein GGS25DRAFT_487838 [Hypoxylon fragiforme]
MAQFVTLEEAGYHPGEKAVHELLRLPHRDNPTHRGLPQMLAYRIAISPLVAFGTLDRRGRPWATIWGGEAGFCQPVARGILGVQASVDARFDPVFRALFAVEGEEGKGEGDRDIVDDMVVKPEGGVLMAGLSIDLATRDRVKIAGRMVVGTATRKGDANAVGDLQMAFQVEESLGNCPKYLNKKHITPHTPSPELVSEGAGIPLPQGAVNLIRKADLFFIASRYGNQSMDTNHRGGAPGFLRILRNETPENGGVTLVYPEFSGNRLYQTLGNLQQDPYAGLVIPDFATGNVIYLTGRTRILVGEKATAYMPRAKLAIKIDVEEARFVRDGLTFRGDVVDYSPYNPAVRRLACEKTVISTEEEADEDAIATAELINRTVITPTIARYTFKVEARNKKKPLKAWRPGQHVTLDFAAELDEGYAHMRDDDPQSLNDDFVRTFTVSRPLDVDAVDEQAGLRDGVKPEFEITVRRNGSATRFLERWNSRVSLEIPVLGFGGAEGFRLPLDGRDGVSVFVAAGVGITPLMAQAPGILRAAGSGKTLRTLWSLKGEDLPLAVDVLGRIDGLGGITRLFVTGKIDTEGRAWIAAIQELDAEVLERRMDENDVLAEGEKGKRKFYACTGPDMLRRLLKWIEGEEVVYESFEY